MFVFPVGVMREAFAVHLPRSAAALERIRADPGAARRRARQLQELALPVRRRGVEQPEVRVVVPLLPVCPDASAASLSTCGARGDAQTRSNVTHHHIKVRRRLLGGQ